MKIVCVSGKSGSNRVKHVNSRPQFLSEMGFVPVMRQGRCSCGWGDCLCLIDPFSTAEKHNVRLDLGDRYDSWHYLFVANGRYSRPEEQVIKMEIRNWERDSQPNDDRSVALNPNSAAYSAAIENRANQLNSNNPEYKG